MNKKTKQNKQTKKKKKKNVNFLTHFGIPIFIWTNILLQMYPSSTNQPQELVLAKSYKNTGADLK